MLLGTIMGMYLSINGEQLPFPDQQEIIYQCQSSQHNTYLHKLSLPFFHMGVVVFFYINRPNTCSSMGDWAEDLLWYTDGRFAKHPYFKVLHNMIMRKKEHSSFIVKQKLGDQHFTVSDLKS